MHWLKTAGADIAYDVGGPLPTSDRRPPLVMIGQPLTASGFGALASYFPDRTVVTYDPRGLVRSSRRDGRSDHSPAVQANDVHAVIDALGPGPVDMFASSGGAVTALVLVREAYDAKGSSAGMAAFISMTSWRGEFTDAYFAQPAVDPEALGLATEDDGLRDDPVLSEPVLGDQQLSPRSAGDRVSQPPRRLP